MDSNTLKFSESWGWKGKLVGMGGYLREEVIQLGGPGLVACLGEMEFVGSDAEPVVAHGGEF